MFAYVDYKRSTNDPFFNTRGQVTIIFEDEEHIIQTFVPDPGLQTTPMSDDRGSPDNTGLIILFSDT